MTQPLTTSIHPPPQAPSRSRLPLLNEDFEMASLPDEWLNVVGAGVAEMERDGKWYRIASPEYVSWLVAQTKRRLADLAPPHASILRDHLRANLLKATLQCPLIRSWSESRVTIPAGYRGPGHLGGHLLPSGVVIGPPYPTRPYRLEDLGEQELQFLGRNHPSIQARFPHLFPARPAIRKRRRNRS